jgi:hypothetical protein
LCCLIHDVGVGAHDSRLAHWGWAGCRHFLADVVDRADVGVVQRRSSLSLSPESAQCLPSTAIWSGRTYELQSGGGGCLRPYTPHPSTAAELCDDAIVRDSRVDHYDGLQKRWLVIGRKDFGQFRLISFVL